MIKQLTPSFMHCFLKKFRQRASSYIATALILVIFPPISPGEFLLPTANAIQIADSTNECSAQVSHATNSIDLSDSSNFEIYKADNDCVVKFLAVGNYTFQANALQFRYLIVAGGGGGADGGGGGGGGLLQGESVLRSSETATIAISVGAGGAGGVDGNATNGANSSIGSTLIAIGGGEGGRFNGAGSLGGSGGGTGGDKNLPGAGTAGQGNAGGGNPASTSFKGGGGGGGAGGPGLTGTTSTGSGGSGGAGGPRGRFNNYWQFSFLRRWRWRWNK